MIFVIDVQYSGKLELINRHNKRIEMFSFFGNDPTGSFKCFAYGENAKKLHFLIKV